MMVCYEGYDITLVVSLHRIYYEVRWEGSDHTHVVSIHHLNTRMVRYEGVRYYPCGVDTSS